MTSTEGEIEGSHNEVEMKDSGDHQSPQIQEEEKESANETTKQEKPQDPEKEVVEKDTEPPVVASTSTAPLGETEEKAEGEVLTSETKTIQSSEASELKGDSENDKPTNAVSTKESSLEQQETDVADQEGKKDKQGSDSEGEHKEDSGNKTEQVEDVKKKQLLEIFGASDEEEEEPTTLGEHKEEENLELDDSDLETKSKRTLKRLIKSKRESQKKSASDDEEEIPKEKRGKKGKTAKEPKKRRSKSDSGSPKKRAKRTRKAENTEEGKGSGAESSELDELEVNNDDEDEPPRKSEERSEIDQILDKMKKPRRKKMLTAEQIEPVVHDIISKMTTAVKEDLELFKENKPALKRVKILPEVISALSKVPYQGAFLERNVLTVLKAWLDPMADGSLPNFNIREAILNLLPKLPIEVDHLKSSGIGKTVMQLSKNPNETHANKKIAESLIQNWSRRLFNLSTSYSQSDYEELRRGKHKPHSAAPTTIALPKTKKLEEKLEARTRDLQRNHTFRAMIPEKASMDFTVRPVSSATAKPINIAAEQKKNQILKKFQQKKSSGKRAVKMSIEGRMMYN